MNKNIYLDNNATTKCDTEVLNAMLPYLNEEYANPSSTYSFGKEIKEQILNAKRNVAKLLNADENEIIFTSCASESNITAIMSAIKNNPNKKHIITTKVEHASIIETMKYLEKTGYKITYLSVDNLGRINLEELKNSITSDTCLIAIMMANNEIGNIYPIKEIGKIAKENNVLFHCDAVQAVGKTKIDLKDINIDTLSLSGHKIHAPKGIGVLYIKQNTPFIPLIFGHQEQNRRGGTENVPYIIGLGKAIELILQDNYESNNKIEQLRNYMEEQIKENINGVLIYGDLDNRLPNTSSIAIKNIKADELLLILESFNIYISTGSACNSFLAEPSHVLVACNADLNNYSPIRISLSKYNTKEEIDIFVKRLITIVTMLRKKKITFRLANENDASEYAHILNKSWKDTYGEYIPEEHIDKEFNIQDLINNFKNYIKNSDFELYMIEYDKNVVGVVELGTCEDCYKDNMEDLGEIRSLHIRKEYQKIGIGRKTMSFALNRLKELNYKDCCVWVKKQNTTAIKFYENNGFLSTEYSCEQTVDEAPSFVMERKL